MSLTDRINHPDRRTDDHPVAVERRLSPMARRVPRWIERMQQEGLPDKDYTGKAAA